MNQTRTIVDGKPNGEPVDSTERVQRTGDFEHLLTIAEICTILKITRRTCYRLTTSGRLSALKIGGQLRIRPEDLRIFLKRKEKR
jgi:excisionase family DNA binding protein